MILGGFGSWNRFPALARIIISQYYTPRHADKSEGAPPDQLHSTPLNWGAVLSDRDGTGACGCAMTRRIFMQISEKTVFQNHEKTYFCPKLPLNRFPGVFNAFKYIEITQGNIYAKGQLQRMDPDSSF